MFFRPATTLFSMLGMAFALCAVAHGACSVDVVMVKGRVQQAPNDARVRVQLIYAKDVPGESGEATIENGVFTIRIEFLTQSRRPLVDGMLEKCNRKPKTVVVTLLESTRDHEYERVSLDFAKDFRMEDPSAYTLRRELVLLRVRQQQAGGYRSRNDEDSRICFACGGRASATDCTSG